MIKLLAILSLLSLVWITPQIDAKEGYNREQFYDIVELTNIIENAREAGLSEKQIAKLEVRGDGKTINVKEYLEDILRRKRIKDKRLQEFLKKKFLTVGDVFKELLVMEPAVLSKLREELISER